MIRRLLPPLPLPDLDLLVAARRREHQALLGDGGGGPGGVEDHAGVAAGVGLTEAVALGWPPCLRTRIRIRIPPFEDGPDAVAADGEQEAVGGRGEAEAGGGEVVRGEGRAHLGPPRRRLE